MKMLIIGSSDTRGATLPDPSQAWPNLVAAELTRVFGEPVDFVDLPLVPVGPKAVPRVESALDKEHPDIVVCSAGAYQFIVGTVGLRVRRRYGERAYRWFRKLETGFERKTASPSGGPARTNHTARWLARRVIGAEAPSTKEEVTRVQTEMFHKLSQREGLIVVLLTTPPIGESLEKENKGANRLLTEHQERMGAVARSHHFLIADCRPGFAAAAKVALRHSDGVHKGATGHRIQADAILSALLGSPSPLAPGEPAPPASAPGRTGA
ncbi:MAG: hypothetical protein IPI85_00810 [Dehalococcoidia bacterium]|nr:hypothetical protein [Dehalococcoidia bacterium]